jgi:hypothetical protein
MLLKFENLPGKLDRQSLRCYEDDPCEKFYCYQQRLNEHLIVITIIYLCQDD